MAGQCDFGPTGTEINDRGHEVLGFLTEAGLVEDTGEAIVWTKWGRIAWLGLEATRREMGLPYLPSQNPAPPKSAVACRFMRTGYHPLSGITVWINREGNLNWRRTSSHALSRHETFELAELLTDLASDPRVKP